MDETTELDGVALEGGHLRYTSAMVDIDLGARFNKESHELQNMHHRRT